MGLSHCASKSITPRLLESHFAEELEIDGAAINAVNISRIDGGITAPFAALLGTEVN
jgi:hypothetical protein